MSAPQSLKFLKLKRRLALSHWQVVGVLESLWLFTQLNAPAGDIGRHGDEEIAAGIEWDGDAADLITALVECRWLDRCSVNRLVVHDWADHVPTYLKGAMRRYGKDFAKQHAKDDARDDAKEHANSTVACTLHPNQAKPSLTKPSQEDCSEPPKAAASEPAVLTFPCVGNGPKEYHLTASKVEEYRQSFPAVDLEAELRKALQWCRDNPVKRKTARGMPAFLTRWLGGVQNRGGSVASTNGKPPLADVIESARLKQEERDRKHRETLERTVRHE